MTTITVKPILLSLAEVRELVNRGQVEIRRPVRGGPVALAVAFSVGQRLWVREGFSARADEGTVRVRFAADRLPVNPTIVAADRVAPRFATKTYRSWQARYMPRALCRFVVEVTASEIESERGQRTAVVQIRLGSECKVQIAKCKLNS